MSAKDQKIIPKFQKKLSGFLSDESGKITKEDVLKMGMVAMGLSGSISDASAVGGHTNAGHANYSGGDPQHANFWSSCSAGANNIPSQSINGHISGVNPGVAWLTQQMSGHGSHVSHGSHGSCGGGHW